MVIPSSFPKIVDCGIRIAELKPKKQIFDSAFYISKSEIESPPLFRDMPRDRPFLDEGDHPDKTECKQ
jgi:hypothetical protein